MNNTQREEEGEGNETRKRGKYDIDTCRISKNTIYIIKIPSQKMQIDGMDFYSNDFCVGDPSQKASEKEDEENDINYFIPMRELRTKLDDKRLYSRAQHIIRLKVNISKYNKFKRLEILYNYQKNIYMFAGIVFYRVEKSYLDNILSEKNLGSVVAELKD